MANTIHSILRRGRFGNLVFTLFSIIRPATFLMMVQSAPIVVIAQNSISPYTVQFKKTETTYYSIADTTRTFTGPELVKLRKQIVIDSLIREVDVNNEITSTIYHLKDTQLEDWMTHPAKTVISKDATVVYDANEKIIVETKHSGVYLQNYESLRGSIISENGDIIPDYSFVTQDLINSFVKAGFTFSDQGPGGSVFTKDTIEVRINNDELSDAVSIYSKSGIILTYLKRGFMKNDLGQIVPDYTISRMWDKRFPGECVQKIVVTDFDNYLIIFPAGNRKPGEDLANEPLVISPNPVDDMLNLTMQPQYFISATLEIMDEMGNILIREYIPLVNSNLLIPVTELSSGYYIIRLYDDKKEINKSFYKN